MATSLPPTDASLGLALRAAHAGAWEWNLYTDEIRWSDDIWSLYGLAPAKQPPSLALWQSCVHPDDRQAFVRVIKEARNSAAAFEFTWRTHPELGPTRWILSRGQPGLIAREGPTHCIGIAMDVTSLQAPATHTSASWCEHQRLLQTILDGVPGLITYWDNTLHNRFANRAYGTWFQTTPEAIQGRHISDVLGAELYQLNKTHIEAALRGERQSFVRDLPVPGHPHQHRIGETHYLPDLEGNEVKGFLVLVFDITHAKRAERNARAANQAKTDFVANISHEMRTPLSAMFGLAQIGLKESTDANHAGTYRQIIESGQHLLCLIDDVLDLAKIEAGKMHLHLGVVDLGRLIEKVLGVTALRASSKGLRLVIDEDADLPAQTLGDVQRLTQILVNLLTNAIKFTDQGEVRLGLSRQGSHLHIAVSDTGPGIPPDRVPTLFEPFTQAHDPQSVPTGAGLGLAISKQLVQLMKGDITVHSLPGRGTTFRVSLPLKEAAPAQWEAMSDLVLIGFPPHERAPLLDQFKQRGCAASWSETLPEALPRHTTVLLHHSALGKHTADQLNERIEAGQTMLVNCPDASSRPTCADGAPLSMDAITLSGPLSPLRVLNALTHRPPPSQRPGPTARRLSGLRILAAEDNPVNRLILGQMLEAEGASIEFAFDGAQAVERIEHGQANIDLILCDIQMPVMDGNEATRRIKRLAPELPIIGLTAHAFSQARQDALAAGMIDYITKPYMLDTLVRAILKHAARPQSQAMNLDPQPDPAHLFEPAQLPSAISDWASMQGHFAPQPGVLAALVSVAQQTLPNVAQQLDRAVQTQDLPHLAKVAHEIKGIALNLRAPALTELACLTQDQSRASDPAAVGQGQRLLAQLRGFLAQLTQPAGEPAPTSPAADQ